MVSRKSWLHTSLSASMLRGAAKVGVTWVRLVLGVPSWEKPSDLGGSTGSALEQGRHTESFWGKEVRQSGVPAEKPRVKTRDKLGLTNPKTRLGAPGHKLRPFSKSRGDVQEGS